MNARELMTHPAATLHEDASLHDALGLLVDRRMSGVPVVDGQGCLVGMLTDGDLLRRAEVGTAERHWAGWLNVLRGQAMNAADYVRSHGRRVGDLMTRSPVSVSESATLGDVVELMEHHDIKQVPVVHHGEVVGIVSRADILRALRTALGPSVPTGGSDADVLARLRTELNRQPWFSDRNLTIRTEQGVIKLEGVVWDEAIKAAIRVAAENVAGIGRVRDDLVIGDTYGTAGLLSS